VPFLGVYLTDLVIKIVFDDSFWKKKLKFFFIILRN